MSILQNVKQHDGHIAPIAIIHGGAGVGKTTAACQLSNPLILDLENGLGVNAVNTISLNTTNDIFELIKELATTEHEFEYLVIDSLTALESIVYADICKAGGVESIEDYNGGYGKGYTRGKEIFALLLAKLQKLRDLKNMPIVMLAHSKINTISPPDKASFDTYQLSLNNKIAEYIHTQADIVGYAEIEQIVSQTDKGFGAKQGKVNETGRRLLHVYSSNKYMSKNRFGITDPITFDLNELFTLIKG